VADFLWMVLYLSQFFGVPALRFLAMRVFLLYLMKAINVPPSALRATATNPVKAGLYEKLESIIIHLQGPIAIGFILMGWAVLEC
jgi:hypothetical protein